MTEAKKGQRKPASVGKKKGSGAELPSIYRPDGQLTKAAARKIRADAIAKQFESWKRHFELTKNPLYVWETIIHAYAWKVDTPDWCMNYVIDLAGKIHNIVAAASTCEFSQPLVPFDRNKAITAAEAAKRMQQAFGLGTQGRNIFERLSSDRELREDARSIHAAEMADATENMPPEFRAQHGVEATRGRLKKRRNIDTSKSLNERIRAGRKLLTRT